MYIVKLLLSSHNIIDRSRMIDDNTVENHYKYDKETRLKIRYTRDHHRYGFYHETIRFFDLHLVPDSHIAALKATTVLADADMKAIDLALHAEMVAFPLNEEEIRKGELYQKIYYAILFQMRQEVLDRVEKMTSEELPDRSIESIRNMLNKYRDLNLFKDEQIEKELQEIEGSLNEKTVILKKKIQEGLDRLKELMGDMD